MKTLNNRILENLIWIREIMIARKQDQSKIDAQIKKKRKEIADNVKLTGGLTAESEK